MDGSNGSSAPKVALVTGASQRIGKAIVMALHSRGYKVAIHYRNSEHLALELKKELNSIQGGSVEVFKADLCDVAEINCLSEQVIKWAGGLDVLVNNASDFFPTHVGDTSELMFDRLSGSNLKGPFFLSQAFWSSLKQSNGSIINLIDIHADRPLAHHPVYCAAKAGLKMLTQSLAKEGGPDIRVNGVAPGAILWPEKENVLDDQQKQRIIKTIPLEKMGQPQDIAKAVCFLLEAQYITGQILAVDGGRSLGVETGV